MDERSTDTYTRFPELDYAEDLAPRSTTEVNWASGARNLGLNNVVFSWAAVLSSLTGEETPVFSLDGEPVKVDPAGKSLQKKPPSDSTANMTGYTGLFTINNLEIPDGCIIGIRCSLEQGHGTIISTGCTTRAYLSQLAKQFEAQIRNAAGLDVDSGSLPQLSILNSKPQSCLGAVFLHDMVQKRGSGLALEFLDKGKSLHTLTYDQFYACSSRLSKRILQSLDPNLATTPIIPLLIPQSPELYVSWLGILQAGAAVCPISIDAPAERVGFIVEDVSADIVITVKGLAAVLSQVHRPLVVIFADDDPDADGASAQAPQNDIQPNPESLAYVMYTSGSTGLPKGVGLSHRAATQALLAHEEHIPHFSRFLQFAAPTFDVSVFEIFFPLFRGATLVACERSVMLNDLVGVINELRVDAAELTPTVAGELLRKKERVPSLKVLLTIGEMLTRRVIDEFGFSSDNSGLLYAMYGPTEATIHCTIAPKLPNYSHVGNIGVPLRTVSAFILPIQETIDEELNVLPLGCIGELAVGGPQLANGYLNRPDENRKAFIESREYGRLYRTGDMARIHPNGELECLGRLSSGQIKLRGQRMEIGEVESTIYKTAGVRNVAVCVVEGILVAFISGEDDPDSQIVRQVCEKWLPKFMVPSDFVHMNELPRLASGKVDRKTLQNDYIRARGSDDVVPDTYGSDLERKIALCAGRILSAKLEASSSLTSLGLDSLKAIKLSSQLRATAINVDVVSILEADSVQGIVRFAEKASELQSSEAPITRLDSWKAVIDTTYNILQSLGPCSIPQDVIPCSPIQVGMIAESMQNKSAYSNLIELRFGQGITADEVCNTFCSVAHGNEILRSSFIEVNQPEHPYACVIWESLDKTVFTECDDFRYEIKNDTQDQLLRPFQVQLKSHDSQVRALIRIHHAIYDGWSWEHIMSDLHAILDKRQGKTRPQYRAFVDYVGKYLCSESKTSDVDYWRDKLQSCSPSQWPNFQDRDGIPRKLVVTHRTFKTDLKTLDAAVLNLRISRQTIFQGALGYLLGEYNGATDTIFGSVSSGRTIPVEGIEDIVGPCINTLPIRLNLENFRSIQDLLAAVHSQNRKTLAHGLLPLRDIKAVSGIDPTIPLFDTLFVWQDTTNDRLNHSTIVHQVASADSLEFSLTLEFEIRNGSICARATFQETILPLSQVDIFLEQLEELASIFMTESKLNLENVHEKLPTALLSAENVDFTKHDGLPSLSDGVSGTAKLDPERIAIEFLESFEPDLGSFKVQRLTYSGLDILSDRLANQLRLLAVVPGSLVCVYLEKSVELYVSILAVIKAGAGYVPITPQTPAQRVHTIITEAKCTVCVTNSDLTETAAIPHGVVAIDSNGNQLGQYEKPCPKQSGDMPSVAYVIFTSGSTGVPKGVLVSHDNMRENIAILSEIYPATPGSKMLQACSPAFDVSVFEIFFTWQMGMTLCSATNDVLFRDLEAAIRILNVTHLSLTPTVASLIKARNVPKVHFLVTAGEALTTGVVKEWADVGVYQGYGPCETTNICTVKPHVRTTDFLSNVGKPFKNTSAFVLSEGSSFSLVPRGVVGELCFGGAQVAIGYLNMPDLTREKFVEHPVYGRVYRSGDFGRLLPDGSLAFVGRRDDLVKLRGQRIELGEVNRAILQSERVKGCTTMICKDKNTDAQLLVSFWVPAVIDRSDVLKDSDISARLTKDLFDTITKLLPTYMVPSFLFPRAHIPMTVNGKVDKYLLTEVFQNATPQYLNLHSFHFDKAGITDGIEKFSELELKISRCVASVTQSPEASIGRHTSFYSLGMDSILAISFSRQLKVEGLGQVDVSTTMKNDTVARLAASIERNNKVKTKRQDCLPEMEKLFSSEFVDEVRQRVHKAGKRTKRILPCTPLQEAMLSHMVTKDCDSYLNHLIFEIIGDRDRLKAAWFAVIERHDILRSWFLPTPDPRFSFAQVVLDAIDIPWNVTECSNTDMKSRIEHQKGSIFPAGDCTVPYAFTEFCNLTTGKSELHLFMHHALYDGEAMAQLLQEVEQSFFGLQLAPVVSFDSYLELVLNTNIEAEDRFWKNYLTGVSPTYISVLQSNNTSSDSEYCRNCSVTLLNLLQAAWAKLLFAYTGESDICFGNVFSSRALSVEGAKRIIGPCFNTLPLRVKLNKNTANSELMLQLRETKADMLSYQLTSLRRIQSLFGSDTSRLFDTLLLLQKAPQSLNGEIWKFVAESGSMGFPIVCEICPDYNNDMLSFCLHYEGSKTLTPDGLQMLEGYMETIRHTIEYPGARAADRSIVKSGVPSFISFSKPSATENHQSRELEEWSAEALEIRELLSCLSKVETKSISLSTTIYKLGLDSINAIQIAADLRKRGYDISAADILEGPTVAEIASMLQRFMLQRELMPNGTCRPFEFRAFHVRHWPAVSQEIGNRLESCVESVRPCTPVQNGMLAVFINSGGHDYFNHIVVQSSSPLNMDSLKQTWQTVTDRNEILRTGFYHVRDETSPFAMITYKSGTFALPWYERAPSITDGAVSKNERPNGIGTPEQLYQPAWYLTVQSQNTHTTVQFSALHALYDAQSLNLMFKEVSTLYHGKCLSEPIPVSPVLGSIITATAGRDDGLEKSWEELCKNMPATKFPDLNPIRTDTKETHTLTRVCSKSLLAILTGCTEAGITLQAAGQAAWARLLASYVGEAEVTYGVVLSGRSISTEAQNVIFPCLTTVPSRYRVEGENRELVQRIMKLNAFLMKGQHVPLTKLQRMASSDAALFDTLFVYQKLTSTADDQQFWKIVRQAAVIDYPVSIELIPTHARLELCITFSNDILPVEQAGLLLTQLEWLLLDSILSPGANCTDLSRADVRITSIVPRKDTRIESPVQLLHQFVERSARQCPSKVALEFACRTSREHEKLAVRTWTYKELDEQGNKYANLLLGLGASKSKMIGICLDKCPEAYFAILAIMKIGSAYVALDPGAPLARMKFIMEDSNSGIVLCTSDKKSELSKIDGVKILALDEPGLLHSISSEPPILERPISSDDTCYCLYTSGSTGTPKGCEITHDNAIQAMLSFQRLFAGHWDDKSRWLQFASFHFDVSVLEQYWSWSVGICVTSCPRDILFEDLAGAIRQLEITHIDLTPSLARLLHPDEVPSLCRGVFITGGEALRQDILDTWGARKVIYNGYGPTEVTIGCTMLPRVTQWDKPSNIGPQFDNVSSYVFLPGTTTPVLRGGIGELCVSGPLVGRGYLNRPLLTEERFQRLDEWGERVYRTGDLVRMLHDESFCFIGRIDDQVKLRGQRLEINEINHVIKRSTKDIGEVVTMVLKHPSAGKEQLVSFISPSKLANKDAGVHILITKEVQDVLDDIRKACYMNLPGYMIPTHFIPLTRFPLSPNNKIENKQLKQFYSELTLEEMQKLTPGAKTNSAPFSAETRTIISIVSKVSGCDEADVSPSSNIFQLGLDSISVISLAQSLREASFVSAHPALVMKYPFISTLAEKLCSPNHDRKLGLHQYQDAKQKLAAFTHKHLSSLATELKIPIDAVETIAPCTPLQEGMIYRCLHSEGGAYLSSFLFKLEPNVNGSHLMGSWQKVQHFVQILRTKFPVTSDGYAQVVLKKDIFPWFELNTTEDDDVFSLAEKRYSRWSSELRQFTDRLWEAGLVSGPTTRLMCLNIFHGIYDGNSLPLLLEKVAQAYFDQGIFETPSYIDVLPHGPLCIRPDAQSFWTQHLQNADANTLPSNGDSSRNRPHFLTVDLTALERLEQVRRDLNVTKLAVIHACWLDVFQRNFGFVPTIGIVTSGRALDYKNADDVIGPLFNTLPSYIPFSNSTSVAELIQTCHNFHVNTLPYQHTPLRDIMKWTGRNADNPLFDTIFVYQKENTNLSRLSKILWTPAESHAEADYPLAIEITDRENGSLAATIVAKSHVLSFEAAERILNEFKNQVTQFSDTETISTRTVGHVLPITGTQLNANFSQEGPPHKHQSKISTSHFRWSSKAKQIRQEIARLANIEEGVVTETTSILELGLDSIDAIKLSSRLKALSITLSVSKIMHCRTIQAMVNEIVSRPEPNDDHHGTLSVIENTLRASLKDDDVDFSNIERVLPATPLQEGMIAEMIASDYRHYFNHDILELEADLNIDKLRVAFTKLIELTPILRTSFIQVSDPELPFSFAQLVHSQNPNVCWTETEIIAKSIDSILEEERVSAASDGLQSPLFRLRLLRERSRKLLLISIAHALYDGWSLDLMHQAIKTSYHGGNLNSPSYHRVLERVVRTANDENCSRFWRGYLENVKPVPFPKRTASDVPQVHRCERELNVPSSSILTFCKSQAITPQALGLTSWMMVLAGCTGQLDVVLGTIMLGRDTPDEENVIFPTMNSVAIRGILHGSRHEMLQYVQGMLSGIRENQHFPLRKVKGLLKIGNQTIFDTLFIYQKRPNAGDLQLYKSIMSSADVEYPVCVEMEISGDSILWRVACKSMVMSKSDTDNLIDQIEACFTEITSNPDAPTVMFNGEAASVCGVTLSASTASSDDTRLAEKGSAVSGSWAPLELAIRTVLSSVSGVPEQNITKDTTLFHIGLDSISAIKVSGLLKKQSIILAVSNMLRAGTVERMAESAKMLCPKDEKLNSRSTSMSLVSDIDAQALLSLNNIHQINVENVVPATPGQIYMIEMWKQSNGLLFFPNFFYTFKGYVTPQRLEESWEQVITKLPILRTEILATGRPDTRYMQVILRSSNNPIIWQKDLSSLLGPGHSAVKKGSKWVTLYASQTDSATVVMLHIHHALYDAVSLGHLVDMLSRGCHGKLNQDGVDADLAHYIGFSSINSSPEIRKAFWTKHLAKAPLQDRKNELCTPIERRAMTNDYRTSFVPDIGALVKVGRSHGISIQSIFLAAYAKTHMKLVSRPSQTETLVIGLYLANRSHDLEALPDLAAPTLNIVPLCIQNIGRPVLHLAQSIQSDVSDISNAQNSCVSLYEVAEWSGVVIDTVVNFLRFPDSTEEGEGRLSRFVPLKEPAIAQKPASSTQTIVKPDGTSVDLKTSFPGLFHSLQDEERSRRIFRPSIDIEAAIRGCSLDVGIFGPTDQMDAALADTMFENLRNELLHIST